MRNGVSVRRDGTACRPSRFLFCHFCSLRSDGCPTALFFCRSVENLCSCRYAGGYDLAVFRSPVFGVRGVCEGKNRKRESVASETRVRSRPFQGLSASLTRRRNGCPSGQQAVLPRGRRGSFPRAFVPCGFRPSSFCVSIPAFRNRDRKLRCDGTRGFPKTPVPGNPGPHEDMACSCVRFAFGVPHGFVALAGACSFSRRKKPPEKNLTAFR